MMMKSARNFLIVAFVATFYSDVVLAKHWIISHMEKIDSNLESIEKPARYIENEIKMLMPSHQNNHNLGDSMIAMLKLLTIAQYHFKSIFLNEKLFWKIYSETMRDLILTPNEDLTNALQISEDVIKEVLDWQTFVDLLKILQRTDINDIVSEWTCFVCMLAIEKSTHLENSFTKTMMLHLNNVRCKANGIWEHHLLRHSIISTIRFDFDAIIIGKKLFNRNNQELKAMLPQMKRILIEETMKIAIYSKRTAMERAKITFQCALLELSNAELSNYPMELAYLLASFNYLPKTYVAVQLHVKLDKRLSQSPIDKSRLNERLKDYDFVRDHIQELFRLIDQVPMLTPKYLDYATIILMLLGNDEHFNAGNINNIKRAYYRAFDEMIRCLDTRCNEDYWYKVLLQYNKYQNNLYNADENQFQHRDAWMENTKIDENLKIILKKANELLQKYSYTTVLKKQLHNLSRLGIQMINLRFDPNAQINGNANKIIEDIALIFVKAKLIGSPLSTQDSVIMKEWYRFTQNFPDQISNVLTKELIDKLQKMANAHLKSRSSDSDAALYVFLVRIVNLLAYQKRETDAIALVKIVFELEQKIGDVNTAPPFIYLEFIRGRQLFYNYYASDILKYLKQLDLKTLIDHCINIITSLKSWSKAPFKGSHNIDVDIMVKQELLLVMHRALKGNRKLIDDERYLRLSQISKAHAKEIASVHHPDPDDDFHRSVQMFDGEVD